MSNADMSNADIGESESAEKAREEAAYRYSCWIAGYDENGKELTQESIENGGYRKTKHKVLKNGLGWYVFKRKNEK